MVRQINAIYSQGTFRPLEPLAMTEGTRVRLSVEEDANASPVRYAGKIHTPRLAHREDAGDFVMEVRETGDGSL